MSGVEFAERMGTPDTHALYGTVLMFSALAYLVIAGGWLLLERRDGASAGVHKGLAGVSAVASVGILVLTVLTGHSGASAAWSGTTAEPATLASPAPVQSTETTPSATATPTAGTPATPTTEASQTSADYTMAQVAENNSAASCFAAIDGNVYDLTDWISQHPGGEDRILALCGTDATSAFEGMHDGDQRPQDQLAAMLLGPLVS
ncbi:Cytochrome b5-like Heme/Steroid binding domain-containing protein [Tessaracoccus bendigoensis DSM 12906]|uniref:Cytochrome b5-like Heme/Steroid binding domain-containing protein n=2 Tax=Tessaracoccus TaxID=72763 RepID=A0A1M6JVV5_9ACTN|nr:Cytochrome b5-like Heme/Steroid binding domain-containing protein [Tessaracoccus bendigoensis DSM 12906]